MWISSPLTIAIFGLFSAGIGAALQGYANFQLESKKLDSNILLERQKFEFSLIQKSLESGDSKEAAKQLLLLVDTDVITSLNIAKIRKIAETPDKIPTVLPPQTLAFQNPSSGTITGKPGGKNIRSGVGTKYSILSTLNTGDSVKVLGTGRDENGYIWYQVYHPETDRSGWVAGQLIKLE